MIRMNERLGDNADLFSRFGQKLGFDFRVAMPDIIQSVDYDKQTCVVAPAIREKILTEKGYEWKEIPNLPDVPFFVYATKDAAITIPVKEGDECLVVFADSCIDAWWESGNISNQSERRRHDLSDGFAIVGFRSQKNLIEDYKENSVQIKYKDSIIEASESEISIKTGKAEILVSDSGAVSIKSQSDSVEIESAGEIKIKGSSVSIMDKDFLNHTHTNGNEGSPTGGVI